LNAIKEVTYLAKDPVLNSTTKYPPVSSTVRSSNFKIPQTLSNGNIRSVFVTIHATDGSSSTQQMTFIPQSIVTKPLLSSPVVSPIHH